MHHFRHLLALPVHRFRKQIVPHRHRIRRRVTIIERKQRSAVGENRGQVGDDKRHNRRMNERDYDIPKFVQSRRTVHHRAFQKTVVNGVHCVGIINQTRREPRPKRIENDGRDCRTLLAQKVADFVIEQLHYDIGQSRFAKLQKQQTDDHTRQKRRSHYHETHDLMPQLLLE